MLASKVMGSGLSGLTVQAVCLDVASGLTATGSSQNDAYAVTTAKAAFSTVSSGTGAVLPSDAAIGDDILIYNGGANPLMVYPPAGCSFNAQSANVPHPLSVKTSVTFSRLTSTLWTGNLSA